jgi:hypothetical protein
MNCGCIFGLPITCTAYMHITLNSLEPGRLLVIEIRSAELLRQHPLLFPAAHHLQWNHDHKNQQQPRPSHPDDDSQDEHRAKHVNRIADAGVDARRYQRRRFSLHAKGASQLNARRYKHKKCWRCNRNSRNAPGSPWQMRGMHGIER